MIIGRSSRHRRIFPSFVWLILGALLLPASNLLSAEAPPRRIGEDRLRLDLYGELEIYALQLMDEFNIPGLAMAIVEDGQVTYAKGLGVRRAGSEEPVDAHSIFEIGSTSKAFTVALTGLLAEEGKLGWTDRVSSHLPGFRLKDPWVTQEFMIEDLYCHRSGMPTLALDNMSLLGFSREEIIAALQHVTPVTSARSRYAYVNNLFLAGAKIIELKTSLSWEDNLDRRIFGPLGMTESTTNSEVVARLENVCSGHWVLSDGSLWEIPKDWIYRDWIQVYGPAGGIFSNVIDMSQWIKAQLGQMTVAGESFLKPETLTYMHSPKIHISTNAAGYPLCYASAWNYLPIAPSYILFHSGETSGQHCMVTLIPSAGAGIVILTNTGDNLAPGRISLRFFNLLYGNPIAEQVPQGCFERAEAEPLLDGPHFLKAAAKSASPDHPGPPLPYERYAGRYHNPAYGVFEVKSIGDVLYCLMGPKAIPATLEPFSGNTFKMIWPQFPVDQGLVTFEVRSGENAHRMIVDCMGEVDGGVFRRVP